jgi:hypothetical protein
MFVPRVGMVLPYSAVLVLGAAALARAVAHNPYLCLSEYGSTVLLSSLWRPALALEFTSLVHVSLLALVPNFFYNMCVLLPDMLTGRPCNHHCLGRAYMAPR